MRGCVGTLRNCLDDHRTLSLSRANTLQFLFFLVAQVLENTVISDSLV